MGADSTQAADFSGYATRNNLQCSDGRIIHADAFKDNDGTRVPLVWQHEHGAPVLVLGHAMLENRNDGVYAYGFLNNTENANIAKELIRHGDITALSIYANNLIQKGKNVVHGAIRELSLVLTGANPGAFIDNVNLAHSADGSSVVTEAIIYTGEESIVMSDELAHSEETDTEQGANVAETNTEKTVQDVFDEFTDEQKDVVAYLVGEALSAEGEDDETEEGGELSQSAIEAIAEATAEVLIHSQEGSAMGRNVFDQNSNAAVADRATLSHSQVQTIIRDGIKMGSFKESFLSHAEDYGITNIDLLFPEARALENTPELLARQADWVPKVLNATNKRPFAKIKSVVADLTPEEARAKGYITGTMKKEEVFGLLRRTTGPTTVYKKQKLDRDDILDITDFDVIAFLKWEIRFMLNEEIARAILVGDGRSLSNEDKVKDPQGAVDGNGIRSIANDHDMYSIKVDLAANVSAEVQVDEITRARTDYRGSGSPSYYTTDKALTDLLLLKDKMGRRLYATEAELASALRVKEIVSVEVLGEYPSILGIIVNLTDYAVGSNRGGELTFFEDFDIDFNQNKYLLETRLSGALTKPKSAIVIRREQGTLAVATAPSFDGELNAITVPTAAGVRYLINGNVVTGEQEITKDTEIVAEPTEGHYFAPATTRNWAFTYTA